MCVHIYIYIYMLGRAVQPAGPLSEEARCPAADRQTTYSFWKSINAQTGQWESGNWETGNLPMLKQGILGSIHAQTGQWESVNFEIWKFGNLGIRF